MSFGLLPIRIIAGIGFIMNGLPKLVNITGTEAEFASKIGLPASISASSWIVRSDRWCFSDYRSIN